MPEPSMDSGRLKPPAGILFDLGDTILELSRFDTKRGNARLLELADNPRNLTADDVCKEAQVLDDALMPLRDASMLELSDECFQKLLFDRLDISFRSPGIDLAREFWDAAAEMRPEPGIHEALDYLRSLRIKMGVVSNTSFSGRILERELEKHRLLGYFDFVIASADYGVRKPHPLIFSVAIKRIQLDPGEIWFVGNSSDHDIAGAVSAGLCGVWYNRLGAEHNDHRPDVEVKSWHEFIVILKDLVEKNHENRFVGKGGRGV